MITATRYPNLNRLHDAMGERLLFGSREKLDLVTSVDVQLHNVLVTAESMAWEFDFKDLWIGRTRWSAMTNQYIDRDALDSFVDSCGAKLVGKSRGVAMMRMRTVTGNHTAAGKTWRRWGGCMLAIGYRALPRPQITLHSRTSYLGYIGAMDLTVAHAVAREVSEAVGVPVEDMAFAWHLEAAQYHSFKSLAFVRTDPERWEKYQYILETFDDAEIRNRYPAVLMHKKWFAHFLKEDGIEPPGEPLLYGDMAFGQTRRIRKRLHTEISGYEYALQFAGGDHSVKSQRNAFKPLPSMMASELDLSRVKRARDYANADIDLELGDEDPNGEPEPSELG